MHKVMNFKQINHKIVKNDLMHMKCSEVEGS